MRQARRAMFPPKMDGVLPNTKADLEMGLW